MCSEQLLAEHNKTQQMNPQAATKTPDTGTCFPTIWTPSRKR